MSGWLTWLLVAEEKLYGWQVTTRESEAAEGKHQYQHIADSLRKEINGEVWKAGGRLPTREQLRDRFSVSGDTVNEALKLLREEGLIVTKRGSGTFVREATADRTGSRPGVETVSADDDGEVWAVVSERVPPVLLKPYLEEAFEATEVRLDVFSMTTESLAARVSDQKDRILTGRIKPPRSINARLMLPDCDSPNLAIPRPMDGSDDPRVRLRLKEILHSHAMMLRGPCTSCGTGAWCPKSRSRCAWCRSHPR